MYEFLRIFNRTNLTINVALHNRVSPLSLTLQHDYHQSATQHSLTAHKRPCLSLVQLCTILNYKTEDQITTHPPMKIKHQCSKSIKRQDLLFNSGSLQQSSTVIKCNIVRLLSHKHGNIPKHYFIWQLLASLHQLILFAWRLAGHRSPLVTVKHRPAPSGCFAEQKNLLPLPGTESQIAHPAEQSLYRCQTAPTSFTLVRIITPLVLQGCELGLTLREDHRLCSRKGC